jgi:catechol 2,3-dioxygenase-like lactoylglutathione lyase family enzyme
VSFAAKNIIWNKNSAIRIAITDFACVAGFDEIMNNRSKTRSQSVRAKDASSAAPKLGGVLETALYTEDLPAAERFYSGVLSLPKIFSEPGRLLAYRCQDSILLIFNSKRTTTEQSVINGGEVPLHGVTGAGHAAFRVAAQDLDTWRAYFRDHNVAIESEVAWPNGAHSIYFRDPAGNSLELATPDMWTGKQ